MAENGTIKFNESTEASAAITINPTATILTITCPCGDKLTLTGETPGWKIELSGKTKFICPCGEAYTL